jgi:hypothetical protein
MFSCKNLRLPWAGPTWTLPKLTIEAPIRGKISTKVAFQYSILPTALENGVLQVVVSDPFDAAMMSAVRFDAKCR